MADRGDRDEKDEERRRADDEGGYGGSRERAERFPEHGFGDRGWGGGRGHGDGEDQHSDRTDRSLPEGVKPVPGGPGWQERYARENRDQYGQSGGQPIAQRGPSQSTSDNPRQHQSHGSTHDVSPRGGYGIRETERLGNEPQRGNFAGKGPKNYKRSDERIGEDVHRRLTEHPDVDASEIDVQVKDGEVTLSGTVSDRHARWAAEDSIAEISGVREVHNNIRLQPSQR